MTVKIARKLAEYGFATLRFDLSGIGDSPNAKTSNVIEQAVADMRDAMDYMQRQLGIERFVVFGICSGAQNGYFLSLKDTRIAGLLMYDGFDFPSLRSKFMHNLYRFRATPWSRIVARAGRAIRRQPVRSGDIFLAAFTEMHPSRDQFSAAIRSLIARGTSIGVIYSGSRRASDSGRGLLGALGRAAYLDGLMYRFEGEMDHTATSQESQRRLLALISDWSVQVANR